MRFHQRLLSDELFQKAQAKQTPNAEVPCRVKTLQGEWMDKCLLIFSSSPPLEDYYANARFVDEIVDLEPSAYALSESVRLQTSRSQPNEKGQAFTEVETAEGKRFSLNWIVNFVDRKPIQGQDLRLADPFKSSGKKRAINRPYCGNPWIPSTSSLAIGLNPKSIVDSGLYPSWALGTRGSSVNLQNFPHLCL